MSIPPEELEALRRNSGIALSASGLWSYRDAEVPHPRVQELFHKGVEVRDNGDVVLNVGKYWCYVSCASVARFVEGITLQPSEGTFLARLKGGGRAPAGVPPRIGVDPASRLFVWLPGHPVATFTQQAHNVLVGYMDTDEDDRLVLPIGHAIWPVALLRTTPSATDTFEPVIKG